MQPLRWETYSDSQLQLLEWEAKVTLKGVKMTGWDTFYTIEVSIFFIRTNTLLLFSICMTQRISTLLPTLLLCPVVHLNLRVLNE